MRKQKLIAAAGLGALLMIAAVGGAAAASPVIEVGKGSEERQEAEAAAESLLYYSLPVWGQITSISGQRIVIDNLSQNVGLGELIIQVVDQETRVLNAVNGDPVALDDLSEGDFIYAYLGPVMTMSLPPITNAQMIICKAPADFKVPEYLHIKEAVMQEDGSVTLTPYHGNYATYHVPADCSITPYLTRNIVTLQNLTPGRSVLLWSDAEGNAAKILLFAGS